MKSPLSSAAPSRLADSNDQRARLTGIGMMCVALISFSLLDVTAKWLTLSVSPIEITWARYVGHFVLSFIVINPWSRPGVWRTDRPWLQIVRSLLLIGITVSNFIALQYLQLDQTMSILFSTPLFVALFAGPMLGEWIGPRRWLAIMVGFLGILIIVRPTTHGLHPAVLASLFSALCYAFYNLCTRLLAATDSTATTMFYSSLIGAVLLSIPLPWFWSMPTDPLVIGNMAVLGVYGGFGHLLLVMAHRRAPAAVLAPFLYSQIIWMILAGWIVFDQVPNQWTLIGSGIVIASGLYLLSRERIQHATKSLDATLGD